MIPWTWVKKSAGCSPFLHGLILGLIISYGIRVLSSKSNRCQQKGPSGVSSSNSNKSPARDQIVNLAFSPAKEQNEIKIKPQAPRVIQFPKCREKGKCGMKAEKNNKPDLLLVGIMTAHAYINTRAKAVWETWAKDVPGTVIFFTGENSYVNDAGSSFVNGTIPLVPLPGVDDNSYPPQKKSFMMLKYMYENYGEDFEWFMRADDDMYLRSDKLADFLRSIDSRHMYFIGQAGKGNQVERGTLNLAHDENFCMGGPGIILSRPTLAKLAPNVEDCLQDVGRYSNHEDVELGRCVHRFAGVSCTWNYEMQSVFYHNSSVERAFTGNLKRREVHRAITLHPVKSPEHLYRLHAYFQGLRIQDLLHETVLLHRDLLTFSEYCTNDFNKTQNWTKTKNLQDVERNNIDKEIECKLNRNIKETGLSPNLNKFVPQIERDIISWDFIGKSLGIYSADTVNPKLKIRGDSKEALEDIIRELMEIINGYSRVRGRVIDFKEILYGYKRINPLYGADYVLDILMTYKKYRGKKMTVPVRRHVYIQRPFSPIQLRIASRSFKPQNVQNPKERPSHARQTNTENMDVNSENLIMIVPLSGRFSTFQRFLESFSRSCLDFRVEKANRQMKYGGDSFPRHNLTLPELNLQLVVVFFGSDVEKEKFLDLVKNVREGLIGSESHDALCSIKVVQIDGEFSRGIALETGISQCNEGDLLFLIDVDLAFTSSVIRRVYLNTVRGKQVYFPVVFSQYNPLFQHNSSLSKNHGESPKGNSNSGSSSAREFKYGLGIDDGYWREYGYGIAAFYKSDFRLAGGFDTSIKGWGKEDVALFERFIHRTNLTVFRAPDPQLVHVFHETFCDPGLSRSQYEMCLGSQANSMGSSGNLMKYILNQRTKNTKFEHLFT